MTAWKPEIVALAGGIVGLPYPLALVPSWGSGVVLAYLVILNGNFTRVRSGLCRHVALVVPSERCWE